MIDDEVRAAFLEAATSAEDADLALAAILLGRIEYRVLDTAPHLARLQRLGAMAAERVGRAGPLAAVTAQVDALNTLLFEDEGFTGNTDHYDDPRNSFLGDVLTRRTGIPISLSVVYIHVGRRAGLRLEGINFPGHFLVRCRPVTPAPDGPRELILDPFHHGASLSEADCRQLLRRQLGEDATYDRRMLARAGKRAILLRMLQNLKRLYVAMRSFPQARAAADLLVALDPLNLMELRDRGLLAFHMQDLPGALRDLEAFFRAVPKPPPDADEEARQEHEQLWDHLKTLRRRAAALN